MDPKPAGVSSVSSPIEESLRTSQGSDTQGFDDEEPFSLSGSSIALFGLAMAFAVVGVPLIAVLTERPLGGRTLVPNALRSNGSISSPPLSIERVSQPGGGNTSRQ